MAEAKRGSYTSEMTPKGWRIMMWNKENQMKRWWILGWRKDHLNQLNGPKRQVEQRGGPTPTKRKSFADSLQGTQKGGATDPQTFVENKEVGGQNLGENIDRNVAPECGG